jgi:hypothetical protein
MLSTINPVGANDDKPKRAAMTLIPIGKQRPVDIENHQM